MTLFKEKSKQHQYTNYVDCINESLESVINQDWLNDEVESYLTRLGREVQVLKQRGQEITFMRGRLAKQRFFGTVVEVKVFSAEADMQGRLRTEAKTQAVSAGQIPRTEWEKLLYGSGPIDGFALHVRVPEHLIAKACLARNTIQKRWGIAAQTMTVDQLIEDLTTNHDLYRSLELGFVVDIAFLVNHVPQMIANKVHEQVIQAFPAVVDSDTDIKETYLNIKKISAEPYVLRGGLGIGDEVIVVLDVLMKISEGIGPTPESLTDVSPFMIKVLSLA